MSKIVPFKGFNPDPKLAENVASLPYDVMSTKEGKKMVEGNPYSFLRVEKAEIDFPDDFDGHSDPVYKKAAENLQKLIKEGVLVQCKTPCFYIYKQKMGDVVQTGLVAGTSVEEYQNNIIKKHEFTRKDKEDDRVRNVDTCNANTGPVFLTYPHKKEIDELTGKITSGKPHIDFVSNDGVVHTLWIVDNKDEVQKYVDLFAKIPYLYIADGHHRSAAASRVYDLRKMKNPNHRGDEGYCYFLSVIFPDNQLYIMDYNRVVKDLHGFTPEQLINKIKEKFIVEEIKITDPSQAKPKKRTQISMYLDGIWYTMSAKKEIIPNDPVKSLDVSLLQDNVLAPLLGIQDPRTDKRIDFVGGIRGMKELVRRCNEDCKVAFAIYPTGMDQLMAIADAGQIMPPKSTWFEPKLRSGMIVRSLE